MKASDCPARSDATQVEAAEPSVSGGLQSRRFSCKPDFDECMARIYAWYQQKIIDRPPVRFHHHNVEYERCRAIPGPWKTHEERWLDVDFQVNAFVQTLTGAEFLGETFPVFWPNLSAVSYNLFLGQHAEFDEMTAWVHPWREELDSLPPIRIQWDNRYFKIVEAMTARALDLAEGKFLVGYTDMYAGVDGAACLRGTEALCMDLITHPDKAIELIERVFSEYPAVYQHFDRMLKEHGQLSVTWMNLPSYETFNVLAGDFAVNISPRHYDEFCFPITEKQAKLFQHNVFHMDGPAVAKHLNSILKLPNLAAIQWVQGVNSNAPIMQWVPLIRKIQEAGKSVVVDLQPSELDEFMHTVDPTGIMLWVNAAPSVQRDILKRVARW